MSSSNKSTFSSSRATGNKPLTTISPAADNKVVEETFRFLEEGEQQIVLTEKRDVAIVIGNTGAGKSTLTQFLAGDNSQMRSIEVEEDTEEYIIIDDNFKISNSTATSKTIFPDLVTDPVSRISYYDCPGFSDTRSSSIDIAATYFTKKVINHLKSIKIIVTISYPSVRYGVDRLGFMKLLRHATDLIKDIKKFKDSIILVVTKVDNVYKSNRSLVSDKKVIDKIASFFKQFRSSIVTDFIPKTVSLKDKQFYEHALLFIDILLTKENDNYTKFSIFRRPNEPGLISEITLLQEGKKSIINLLEKLTYVKVDHNDFGYTVSDTSKNDISALAESINKAITYYITSIGKEIGEYYDSRVKLSNDMHQLQVELTIANQVLEKKYADLQTVQKPKQFLNTIIKDLDFEITNDILSSTLNQMNYLEFLQEVSGKELPIRSVEWLQSVKQSFDYVEDVSVWFHFLTDMYDKLSSYEIQQDVTKYNVADLNDWGVLGKRQGIHIYVSNLKLFLTKIENLNIRQYDRIRENADDVKLKALNNVLRHALKHKTKFTYPGSDKLVVIGDYVKFSDINTKTNHNTNNNISFVEIFALNTVFVDADLDSTGRKALVSVIAPRWDVIGQRSITLNGSDGKFESSAGKDSKSSRFPGKVGEPGLPGGSAGSFLGIGEKMNNGKGLSITANGGFGGNGRAGGYGHEGAIGDNPEQPDIKEFFDKNLFVAGAKRVEYESSRQEKIIAILYNHFYAYDTYMIHGEDGGKGSDGGNGGRAGKGGNRGELTIALFDDLDVTQKYRIQGYEGEIGTGGVGGLGGYNGNICKGVVVFKNYLIFPMIPIDSVSWNSWECEASTERGLSGNNGTDNHNSDGQREPESVVFENKYPLVISTFKHILRENLNDDVRRQALTKFYNHLESNSNTRRLYDTLGLVDELQSLESDFYKLNRKIDFQPYYLSLLNRILEYAHNPKRNENSLEYRKVLSYLYTSTLSKLCSLDGGSDKGDLIIDMVGYLNLAEKNIMKRERAEQAKALNDYRNNYKSNIDKQIAEGVELVNTQITRELDNVNLQIEDKIQLLINDTIILSKNAEVEKEQLMKKKNELEHQLVLKTMFNSIKAVSQVVSFLGPWGAAIGGIVGTSSSIVENLVLDDSDQVLEVMIPQGVHDILNKSNDILKLIQNKKIKAMEEKIKLLSEGAIENPENLNVTLSQVSKINDKLLEISKNDNDESNVAELERELSQILHEKEEELKLEMETTNKKVENSLKVISRINKLADVFEAGVDVYEKYKNNKSEIDEVSSAIEQSKEKINMLKEFEDQIYKTVYPMVSGMRKDMNQFTENLKTKSKVHLTVAKWQVQSSLKEMRLQMQQITRGFQVQENLSRCIEKIDEAMTTMINVYDQIQNYQEQKTLADYMADIASTTSQNIQIHDQELRNAVSNLEVIIQSNIVLGQYKRAVDGFKQFVFPFAGFYLNEFSLPTDLQVKSNVDSLVGSAIKQIDVLKSKLTESNVSVNKKYDKYIQLGDFHSETKSTIPFYVWKNDKYINVIEKLLAGTEVTFKADIMNSAIVENAVKFNLIEIHFKSHNQTMQMELNAQLQNFGVIMTHSGNSYYRCDNEIYTISSESQTLAYSFERNKYGPVTKNKVYDKIMKGDLMLSPYAMWKIRLTNDFSNKSFKDLKKYKDQVDLELVGWGQYLSRDAGLCNSNLKDYYRLDETLSKISKLDAEFDRMSLVRNSNEILKQNRKVRYITGGHRNLYGLYLTSGGTSTASSPINGLFNWVTRTLRQHAWNPVKKLGSWSRAEEAPREDYYNNTSSYESAMDSIGFYDNVDSGLVLAPVVLHLWKKFFNRSSGESKNEGSSSIDISVCRVELWNDFIGDARELVEYMKLKLGGRHLEVMWYADALEAREKNIQELTSRTRVNVFEVEDLEKNLIAFQTDINEDIQLRSSLTKIRNDKHLLGIINKLMHKSGGFPVNVSKTDWVISKEYRCQKEGLHISNEINNLVIHTGTFISNKNLLTGSVIQNCIEYK